MKVKHLVDAASHIPERVVVECAECGQVQYVSNK